MALFGREKAAQAVMEREPSPRRPDGSIDCDVMDEHDLAEYRALANTIALDPVDLVIEEFRLFLAKHDIPTFNVGEVVAYMNDLTKRDNPSKLGWHWCPVRAKDKMSGVRFGNASMEDRSGIFTERQLGGVALGSGLSFHSNGQSLGGQLTQMSATQMAQMHLQAYQQNMQSALTQSASHQGPATIVPGSDFYHGDAAVYTRLIPMHALKKIALVEKEFKGKVNFLVTEYTTQPHVVVTPDPFLMAVIPNPAIHTGKGRFIIDVWDEPGFGITRMVK
jgi:hypothetical protein